MWNDGLTRRRYSLHTADINEARARAPSRYAELTKPKLITVQELWQAYVAEKAALTDYVIEYNGKPVISLKKALKQVAQRSTVPT